MNTDKTQCYMGVPNGAMLCIDWAASGGSWESDDQPEDFIRATVWHGYSEDGIRVTSYESALNELESLYDMINFPQPTTTYRSFAPEGTREHRHDPRRNPYNTKRYHTDDELLEKRGELVTFIIRVQQRQNSSWQGRITWVERDKTLRFRTIMELLRLIEEAVRSKEEV